MTPADQTTFGYKRFPFRAGNCLSACVASILDIPTDAVPDFIDKDDRYEHTWLMRLNAWLAREGLCVWHYSITDLSECADFCDYYIAWGNSVKYNLHAVVAKRNCIVHDPHPSRTGLRTVSGAIVITPCEF